MASHGNLPGGAGTHSVVATGPSGHGAAHHVASPLLYWVTFAALMVFLVLTVAAAFFDIQALVGIPGLNIGVALLIATVKAGLVVAYFMHVKGGTRLTYLWAITGFIWLFLMFLMIGMDYYARHGIHGEAAPNGWERPTGAANEMTAR